MRAQDTPTPAATSAAPSTTEPKQSKPKQAAKGCEQFRSTVEQYDWDVEVALAVMRAESGCDPEAFNGDRNPDGSNDAGLFQINSVHVFEGKIGWWDRFSIDKNVRVAYMIYKEAGWSAWSAYNNGSYRKFM